MYVVNTNEVRFVALSDCRDMGDGSFTFNAAVVACVGIYAQAAVMFTPAAFSRSMSSIAECLLKNA